MDFDFSKILSDMFANGMSADQIATGFTDALNQRLREDQEKAEAERKAQEAKEKKIEDFMEVWDMLVRFLYEYGYINDEEWDEAILDMETAEELIAQLDDIAAISKKLKGMNIEDLLDDLLDEWAFNDDKKVKNCDCECKKDENLKKDNAICGNLENKDNIAPTLASAVTKAPTEQPAEKVIKTPNSTIKVRQLTPEEAAAKQAEIDNTIKETQAKIDSAIKSFPKIHIHGPGNDLADLVAHFLGRK